MGLSGNKHVQVYMSAELGFNSEVLLSQHNCSAGFQLGEKKLIPAENSICAKNKLKGVFAPEITMKTELGQGI